MNMHITQRISSTRGGSRAALAIACVALLSAPFAHAQDQPGAQSAASATTLERIRSTGRISLGYLPDARPFSYRDGDKAAGYAVAVCRAVAEQIKTQLGVATLAVETVATTAAGRLADVRQGKIDLLCSGEPATLGGRESVSYSIPIFAGGIGALMRAGASERLRAALEERPPPYQALWRGSTPDALEKRAFVVVAGTPAVAWSADRIKQFGLSSTATTVPDTAAGVARVLDGSADALFGERAVLLDAAKRSASPAKLVALSRLYRYQPIALALARGDEDFRLTVDRALSKIYASPTFGTTYGDAFGDPDADTVRFFRSTALPE
jgi:polar amino acid transport system substrate-binding protein